jgi:hypothetical protein
VKAKPKTKRDRTKPSKAFGGFAKLTRSEVEWLKRDLNKTIKQVTEVPALPAETPIHLDVPEEDLTKANLLETERFVRDRRLATAVDLVVNRALNGSKWCGVFLGELIPFLARKEPELMANEHFKLRISELRCAQKPRKKGRTLRTEIEEIIRGARSQRHVHHTLKGEPLVPHARKDIRNLARRAKLLKKEGFKLNSKWLDDLSEVLSRVETSANDQNLQKLADLSTASADAWFENVVWPELQHREPKLRANRLIGELKKANKSGKFQLSDLKTQARATVKRLAVLPRAYFFS